MTRTCPDHPAQREPCRDCHRQYLITNQAAGAEAARAALRTSRDTGRTERADDTEETL